MICATYEASGQVVIVNPPPVDISTCALLIPTPADRQSPFDLSVAGGSAIATAIVFIWAVGFCFRALIRTLNQ